MKNRLRPDPFRSRRALVLTGALIVASQVGVGLFLDAMTPEVRFPPAVKILERANAIDGAPQVALLGSSRFLGININEVDAELRRSFGPAAPRALQASVMAADPVVIDFVLEQLITQGTRPSLAILEVSPETLSYPTHWLSDHVTRFFTWREIASWAPELIERGKSTRLLASRFTPLYWYRREVLAWLVGTPPPYLKAPGPAKELPAVAAAAAPEELSGPTPRTLHGVGRIAKWLRNYRLGGGSTRALESALERCRREGIPAILLGVPVTSWHRELYTEEIEGAYLEYITRISNAYRVPFVDYTSRLPDRMFYDQHHLNREGGRFLARALAREIVSPAWSELEKGPSPTVDIRREPETPVE